MGCHMIYFPLSVYMNNLFIYLNPHSRCCGYSVRYEPRGWIYNLQTYFNCQWSGSEKPIQSIFEVYVFKFALNMYVQLRTDIRRTRISVWLSPLFILRERVTSIKFQQTATEFQFYVFTWGGGCTRRCCQVDSRIEMGVGLWRNGRLNRVADMLCQRLLSVKLCVIKSISTTIQRKRTQ